VDDMNASEVLKALAEENRTRQILEILTECETVEVAREKVKALLG
jgi:hypothetical protein